MSECQQGCHSLVFLKDDVAPLQGGYLSLLTVFHCSTICIILHWRFITTKPSVQGGAGGCGLGLVDLDLGHSTTCPVVLRQVGVWLNQLGS